MLIKTKYAEYRPQNLAILHDDRIHGVILRLETYMTVFLIESFDRGRIIDQSYYSISVISSLTTFYKNLIAAVDTHIDHGISLYLQNKGFAVRYHISRDREVALDILFRKDRLSCRHLPDHRQRNHLRAHHLEIVITDLNRAGFRRIPSDIAVLLKRLQVRVDRRGGF